MKGYDVKWMLGEKINSTAIKYS